MKKLKEYSVAIVSVLIIIVVAVVMLKPTMKQNNAMYEQYSLPSDETKGVIQNFVGRNAASVGVMHYTGYPNYPDFIYANVNQAGKGILIEFVSSDGGNVFSTKDNPKYDSDGKGEASKEKIAIDNRIEYKVISQTPPAGTAYTIGGSDEPSELILNVEKVK